MDSDTDMLLAEVPTNNQKLSCAYSCASYIGPLSIAFAIFMVLISIITTLAMPLIWCESQTYKIIGYSMIVILVPMLIMILISLYITVTGDSGETKNALANKTKPYKDLLTPNFLASLPTCPKCGLPKPPRAHHCSVCGRCHLRMDHHCPAIGRCVAIKNIRPFIVMLHWGLLASFFYVISCVITFCLISTVQSRIVSGTTAIGALALLCMLTAFYNSSLGNVIANHTTIEDIGSSPPIYNLGHEENLRQIFGTGVFRLWIPKRCELTGFEWALAEYVNV